MNTVEQRLRAALAAKSDAVTLTPDELAEPVPDAMTLTADGFAGPAPDSVVLIPDWPERARRRWPAAVAGVAAAAVLIAVGATALAGRSGNSTGQAAVGTRAEIPWSQVGPGWTLIQSNPQYDRRRSEPDNLYLVDPSGQHRYLIRALTGTGWILSSWSAATAEALFVDVVSDNATQVVELNPQTLATRAFTVRGNYAAAQYLGSSRMVLSDGSDGLLFIDPDGNNPVPAPMSVGDTGDLHSSTPVITADGRYVVEGAENGVGVLRPDGSPVRGIAAPAGYLGCHTTGAWSATQVAASCVRVGRSGITNTILFPLDGTSAAHLLSPPTVDSSWQFWNLSTGSYGYLDNLGDSRRQFGRFGRLDRDDQVTPIATPSKLAGASWQVVDAGGSNIVIRFWFGSYQQLGLLYFNPATGDQTVLYRPGQFGGSTISAAPYGFAAEPQR